MDKIREELAKPFDNKDIEWRLQQSGKTSDGKVWAMCLAYVTNRAIMDRLDDVFGVGGWKNEFHPTPTMDGVMCGISAKFGDEWITKFDGAQNTDIEAVKGGLSSAMKRTGVQFGIGRYLYHLDAGFAKIVEKNVSGAMYAKTKDSTFYWVPPELPNWALPIDLNQIAIINGLLKKKGSKIEDVVKFFNLHNISNATKEQGVTAIEMLNKKPDVEAKK